MPTVLDIDKKGGATDERPKGGGGTGEIRILNSREDRSERRNKYQFGSETERGTSR